MKPRLSVCIPTYNRAAFIGETLESIASQATEDVEIVISDNASTDNTEDIVNNYRQKFSNLVYVRQLENLGADANYMNVVANASGQYCWLFGSDDTMREGALHEILEALKSEPAVVLSNRMVCDLQLKPQGVQNWLKEMTSPRLFNFSSDEDCKRYFESATSLGAVFSYLSNIVVRRELWDSIPMNPHFMGTAYSHVYKLMVILLNGGRLLYQPEWTVYCRLGNDSFLQQGELRRVLLDIDGYTALADTLLANRPDVKKEFLGILQREYPHFAMFVKISALASDEGIWPDVREKFVKAGFDQALLRRAERIGAAGWFKLRIVRRVVQVLSRLVKQIS